MKKVTKASLLTLGVTAIAWWLGGMMYFIMVTKHFKDQEKYENAGKSIMSYLGGVTDGGVDDAPVRRTGGISDKPKPTPSYPRAIRDRRDPREYKGRYKERQFDFKPYKPDWTKYIQEKPES